MRTILLVFNALLEGLLRSGSVAKVPLKAVVYARHGRELMGLKSPVSVPVL